MEQLNNIVKISENDIELEKKRAERKIERELEREDDESVNTDTLSDNKHIDGKTEDETDDDETDDGLPIPQINFETFDNIKKIWDNCDGEKMQIEFVKLAYDFFCEYEKNINIKEIKWTIFWRLSEYFVLTKYAEHIYEENKIYRRKKKILQLRSPKKELQREYIKQLMKDLKGGIQDYYFGNGGGPECRYLIPQIKCNQDVGLIILLPEIFSEKYDFESGNKRDIRGSCIGSPEYPECPEELTIDKDVIIKRHNKELCNKVKNIREELYGPQCENDIKKIMRKVKNGKLESVLIDTRK